MKGKINKRGSSFRGCLNYVLDKNNKTEKKPEIVASNMSSTTISGLSKEFGVMRESRSDITKPVWHASLSLSPEEARLSADKWQEIAEDYLTKMGVDTGKHQWVAVRHNDTDKDHIHIILNRVGLDGSVWLGQNDVYKSIETCQDLEIKHNLKITKGLVKGEKAEEKTLSKNEIEMAIRTGNIPPKKILQDTIKSALKDKPDFTDFINRLETAGISIYPNIASNGTISGISFGVNDITFKGSGLGKKYSWLSIKKGVKYDEDRHNKLIREIKATNDSRNNDETGTELGSVQGSFRNTEQRENGSVSIQNRTVSHSNGENDAREYNSNQQSNIEHRKINGDIREHKTEKQREFERIKSGNQDGKIINTEHRRENEENNKRHIVKVVSDSFNKFSSFVGSYSRIISLSGKRQTANDKSRLKSSGWDNIATNEKEVKMTPQERKKQAWQSQHKALQAEYYRITLKGRGNKDGITINLGKKDNQEVFFTAKDVEEKIPALSRQNMLGFDIYITPIDTKNNYLVVDDLTEENLKEIKGFYTSPTLVQQSSENNFQAIYKLPKDVADQQMANKIVSYLNKKYGDPKFSGAVHPFRMAGFSNKKAGKNNAFTTIREVNKGLDMNLVEFAEDLNRQQSQAKDNDLLDRFDRQTLDNSAIAKDYQTEIRQIRGLVVSKGWEIDMSRIDFNACKGLFKKGYQTEEIEEVLAQHSPNIEHRKHNIQDYTDRTVRNAWNSLDDTGKEQHRTALDRRINADKPTEVGLDSENRKTAQNAFEAENRRKSIYGIK